MSFAFATTWRLSERRELLIGIGLAAGVVTATMVDCILFQIASGGADLGLALRWLVGAVAPWAVVFVVLRVRAGRRPGWEEAGMIAAALALSTSLDAALIPLDGADDLLDRLKARAPLALLIPLAARLRLEFGRPKVSSEVAASAPADPRLARAQVVIAAGNYVEVEGPGGRRLLRMTIAEAEAAMDPDLRLRIHRSTLVRRDLIAWLERDRNGVAAVRLADGRSLRVGPNYRARVREAVEG